MAKKKHHKHQEAPKAAVVQENTEVIEEEKKDEAAECADTAPACEDKKECDEAPCVEAEHKEECTEEAKEEEKEEEAPAGSLNSRREHRKIPTKGRY